ncbi:MAG TPA: arginine--tRNA ligase [Lentisphaeria bacterium]|nr:MAG: arginine--tRNA ligase [Lentisphaerae bacterium GWF2_50_93]HCE45422.1 arginine--tRNA ligase [Lentisphaeria bacterium]
MNFKCLDDLKNHLNGSYTEIKTSDGWDIIPEICPAGMNGDITVNCFRFAKIFRKSPDEIAQNSVEFLSAHPDVEKAEKVKAFVNLVMNGDALHRDTVGKFAEILSSCNLPVDKRRRVLIEFSAPNTNKPQHLGHVRNNTIGMSLASLMKRVGHEVFRINLVNDRGIHICKSMIAYQRFGNGATPESTGRKGDHLVGDFYVKFDTELRRQLKELKEGSPEFKDMPDEELFLKTEIGGAAQEMLQKWEAGDPEVVSLWKRMNVWVFAGFAQTYRRMGVEFEHTYLESQTYLLGKDLVVEGLAKGTFFKRDDGAILIDLEDVKLGKKVLLRSDGTSVYMTQDLGTTLLKYRDYSPDIQIWVVGDEQIHHFKTLFAILKKMGNAWADNLHHLSYGMVNLPTGKMKSREGTVVDADDLFDEMVNLAKSAALERVGEGKVPDDIDRRSEIIGIGAIKFNLLKFNPKTTIMFDPQASIKFEGDTGPYVQYACARINSIERKARESGLLTTEEVKWNLASSGEEKELSVRISQYPEILKASAERMDCSMVSEYLLELAKAFNRFYREHSVLNSDNDDLKKVRIALCFRTRDILVDGLKTLTIDVPEAM